MKNFKLLSLITIAVCMTACSQSPSIQVSDKGTKWSWNKGTIVIETPERPTGQTSVIGLTAPKMDAVRVGFVGLGMRGPSAVERFTYIPGVEIVALCDYEQTRANERQKYLRNASMPKAVIYFGEKGYGE